MLFLWYFIQFIIAGTFVFLSGTKLTKYSEKIAVAFKLSAGWVGFILLSVATSLPEAISSIFASSVQHSVDLVFGNILGSNMTNIMMLSIFFGVVYSHKNPFRISLKDAYSSFAGILLLSTMAFFFFLDKYFVGIFAANITIAVIVIFAYLAMSIYYYQISNDCIDARQGECPLVEEKLNVVVKKNKTYLIVMFLVYMVLLAIVAIWLTRVARLLAYTPFPNTNFVLGESFVGMLLLAIVTSIPEMSVLFTLIKSENIHMAMGDTYGSNLFNIVILVIAGAIYPMGDFYRQASNSHTLVILLLIFASALSGLEFIDRAHLNGKRMILSHVMMFLVWVGALVISLFVM